MQSRHQLREQILAADSIDAAVNILANAVQEIGINQFITGYVRGSAQDLSGRWRMYKHRSFNFPSGGCRRHLYSAHCPDYHACFDGRVGFVWASVRARHDLTAKETQAWHYLADFGLIQASPCLSIRRVTSASSRTSATGAIEAGHAALKLTSCPFSSSLMCITRLRASDFPISSRKRNKVR